MSVQTGSPQEGAGLVVSPPAGAAGREVTVRLPGLSPDDRVLLGFGGIGSPHEVMGEAAADADGTAKWTVRIPDWVEAGRTYLFFWAWIDMRPVSFSTPFLVTDPEGGVRITGTVTDEGVTCSAMRDADDVLYTLAGAKDLVPGDRITVDGTFAEMSVCGQGITLTVRAIEVNPEARPG